MLDFSGIVLSALQGTFSRPILVYPYASQPGEGAYSGRGVFSTAPTDIVPELSTAFSDQHTSIWIRLSEYPILPMRDDQIEIGSFLNAPAEGTFVVQDVNQHASGKMILMLKKLP